MPETVWAVLAAAGVPSLVMGLVTWRLKKSIDRRDKIREEKVAAQQRLLLILVKSSRASISLGEATAHALQEGHTNGDMKTALEYAGRIKNEQKDFLAEQGLHAMLEK